VPLKSDRIKLGDSCRTQALAAERVQQVMVAYLTAVLIVRSSRSDQGQSSWEINEELGQVA
jgi:hypothetical protein